MKIYYKGFLCNLAPYRVMGEDRHALFPVTQSNDLIFYEEWDYLINLDKINSR